MKKSGLADSPFFSTPLSATSEPPQPIISAQMSATDNTKIPSDRDTVIPRYHDTTIEAVRRAVKAFGKEAATHRFTLTEKRAIANIVHALHMQGIRTTENEITRIAINFVIDEFNRQEKESLLGRVLQALKQ